jgi:hypothetical protein
MVTFWKSVMRQVLPLLVLGAVSVIVWAHFQLSGWSGLLVGVGLFAAAFTVVSYVASANDYERNAIRKIMRRALVK